MSFDKSMYKQIPPLVQCKVCTFISIFFRLFLTAEFLISIENACPCFYLFSLHHIFDVGLGHHLNYSPEICE